MIKNINILLLFIEKCGENVFVYTLCEANLYMKCSCMRPSKCFFLCAFFIIHDSNVLH